MKKKFINTMLLVTSMVLMYKLGQVSGQFSAGMTAVHKEYMNGKIKIDIMKDVDA